MNTLKDKFRYISVTILAVLLFGNSYAQDRIKIDFFEQIKNYNLSKVIAADSIISENREEKIKEKAKRPEILGFIGNNYQRFLFILPQLFRTQQILMNIWYLEKQKLEKPSAHFKEQSLLNKLKSIKVVTSQITNRDMQIVM